MHNQATHSKGTPMTNAQNTCAKHRATATVAPTRRSHTLRKSFVVLAGLAVAGLVTASTASASVLPSRFHGTHLTKVAPKAVVEELVFCQYDASGHTVTVGLPLGFVGHRERVEVDVVGQAPRIGWMPAAGSISFTFPSITVTQASVTKATWDGHTCDPT